jgi:hypothetical protein
MLSADSWIPSPNILTLVHCDWWLLISVSSARSNWKVTLMQISLCQNQAKRFIERVEVPLCVEARSREMAKRSHLLSGKRKLQAPTSSRSMNSMGDTVSLAIVLI